MEAMTRAEIRRQRWIGALMAMIFFAGAVNLFIATFCLPKFSQMFQDAFGPDYLLPTLSHLIFILKVPLIVLGLLWPVMGIAMVRKIKSSSVLWLYIPFFLSVGQLLVTLFGLALPMWTHGDITGMSDSH
jgi:hypothetical protein